MLSKNFLFYYEKFLNEIFNVKNIENESYSLKVFSFLNN